MFFLDLLSLMPMAGILCLLSCLNTACHEAESEIIINLRPKVEYSSKFMLKGDDEKRCSICLDDYEDGEMVEFLDCFHLFHGDCIDKWLPLSQTCPVCRHQC